MNIILDTLIQSSAYLESGNTITYFIFLTNKNLMCEMDLN